jgi:predicted DNA-binding transcriptional regulator AlpA
MRYFRTLGETQGYDMSEFQPKALKVNDAAKYTGVGISTLDKLRSSGGGPVYCKVGKSVVYLISDLDSWLREHRVHSTSEK